MPFKFKLPNFQNFQFKVCARTYGHIPLCHPNNNTNINTTETSPTLLLNEYLHRNIYIYRIYTNIIMYPTLLAAPPWITDFTKIPRSRVPLSVVIVLPLTLTPRPAEPDSDRGMSRRRISLFRLAVSSPSVSPDFSGGCKTGRVSETESSRWNREGPVSAQH